MNNKGFTLIELVVTVAIIATLASMAVPMYGDVVMGAKSSADDASLLVLNDATTAYAMLNDMDTEEVFDGIESDQMRMQILLDNRYLMREVEPQQDDVDFVWDEAEGNWMKDEAGSGGSGAPEEGYNTPAPTENPSGETGGEATPEPTETHDYVIYGYGMQYQSGEKVWYNGEFYMSHKATKKIPGQHKDWQKISDEWFQYNTYNEGEIIYYNGSQYKAKKTSVNKNPETKQSHWEKIS